MRKEVKKKSQGEEKQIDNAKERFNRNIRKRNQFERVLAAEGNDDHQTKLIVSSSHNLLETKFLSSKKAIASCYESPLERLLQRNKDLASNIYEKNVMKVKAEGDIHTPGKKIQLDSVSNFKLITGCNNAEIDTLSCKSPSNDSTDSAKGSSIDSEIDFAVKSGDIYWARISPFPYWPCIIWPDPLGRTMILSNNKAQRQNIKLHVRFFGDNGRRSWVHRSNIITYTGRSDFEKIRNDYINVSGKKNTLYKSFIVTEKKRNIWEKAVIEADEVSSFPHECREAIFERILLKARELMATKKLRRRSFSTICSANEKSDIAAFKRQRLPNDHQMIDGIKKIKIDRCDSCEDTKMVAFKAENLKANQDFNSLYCNDEFGNFYNIIKKHVLKEYNGHLENYLLESVKNIWYLRHLARTENIDSNSEMNFRRFTLDMIGFESNASINLEDSFAKKYHEKTKKTVKTIDQVVEDIISLNKNFLFKGLLREPVCKACTKPANLVKCGGGCQGFIHVDCADIDKKVHITGDLELQRINNSKRISVMCFQCKLNKFPSCFVCNLTKRDSIELIKCKIGWCNNFYHLKCLKYWPQSKVTQTSEKTKSLLCPSHVCHTCVSDDPRGKFLQIDKSKLVRCIYCPATYHSDSFCIPAGAKLLTATQIICPRHGKQDKFHVNVNWCFICVTGGDLICCDSCPTAFHVECLNILKPDENYICEECETGRLPLYGELVWAKLGSYRWWPAIIIPPPEVPRNLENKKHHWSEFCIRFFGTNDHSWISRNRVFLYQEGDWGKVPSTKGNINHSYREGLKEARRISELFLKRKQGKIGLRKENGLAPLPYIKIKSNRPVPPVKIQEIDVSELTPCECSVYDDDPCGPYSGCLNRILMTECNPKVCPAGTKCQNQLFEKRIYPPLKVHWTNERGWGLTSEEDIKSGTFLIEYIGEIIDDIEFKRRIAHKQEQKDENYYFLTLEKDYKIDAGPKGNLARFMNHSCEPNCETQKWTVNGVTRIGLFAIQDILSNTELTFNYYLESIGDDKKVCLCGTNRCSGFIGTKYKPEKNDRN